MFATSITRRPAAERFHSQLDWLDSWHSFSFSSHYDPAWMGFGPLRVINDDTIAAGRGFGMHPHRDMEIITVMVEGELHHRDSMGHAEVLRAGEVQRMSAGTGVVHSEINGGDQPCRLLQIWIEPSSTGIAPAYEQKPFALPGGWTRLLDPQRREGAMAVHRPVQLWRARLQPGDLHACVVGGALTSVERVFDINELGGLFSLVALDTDVGDGEILRHIYQDGRLKLLVGDRLCDDNGIVCNK